MSLRFLQVASRYQVQLGWLRVIAAAIGDGRMSIEEVSEVLLSHREQFNGWWEQTGLEGPSRGIAQPATANRAARIGVTFGIHDPDSGRLTPLGQVLRTADPWQRSESPLIWSGATRWLGLWLSMSAAGDVLLSVLRTWPQGGLEAEDAPGFVAGVLRELAERATPDARRQLLDQAGRSGGKLRFARNFLIYPYLEPLRDLGYLQAAGKAGGYLLTPEGTRLRDAISDDRDADAWLEDGLHRAFLAAMQVPCAPMDPGVLSRTLADLPEVLGGPQGAGVLPVLLLAQARLSGPCADSAVLELSGGRDLLRDAAARSGGQLTLSGDQLQWRRLDPGLWQSPVRPEPAQPAPTRPTPARPAPAASTTIRHWLQHTAALLQAPVPGGPQCWGGPRSALARLRDSLAAGVPRQRTPIQALADQIPATADQALLHRVVERWDTDAADAALQATLRRAQVAADADADARIARLKADLAAPAARAEIAILIGDALAVDGWPPDALRDQLCRRVATLGEADGAAAFLDDLRAPPSTWTYVQLLGIPLPLGEAAGVSVRDGVAGQRQVWVTLQAPCAAAALQKGRARIASALRILCYAARLPVPEPGTETLSPPPPADAPVPGWLLLPMPAPAPLPLPAPTSPDAGALTGMIAAAADGTPAGDVAVLSAAAAIGMIREGLVAAVFAADAALHHAALLSPAPAVLSAIAGWGGPAEAYRKLATTAPLLRSLKQPHPTPRHPGDAARCLDRIAGVHSALHAEHPALTERLSVWADTLSDPGQLAALARQHRQTARRLLSLPDTPADRRAALLDPVIREAIDAAATGTPLALHWGAILDRFDDLATLSGTVSAARRAEILGW